MSQSPLYGYARLDDNFIEAIKFYENGPIVLVFNMKIKNSFLEKVSEIDIVSFTESDFSTQFDASQLLVGTDNYNFFNKNTINVENSLVKYHNQNFGSFFKYTQEKDDHKNIEVIKKDRSDLFFSNGNLYKIFLTKAEKEILLEKDNVEENNNKKLKFRVLLKDVLGNIIWDSNVVTLLNNLSYIINNFKLEANLDVLRLYLQNITDALSLSYEEQDSRQVRAELSRLLNVKTSDESLINTIGGPSNLNYSLSYKDLPMINIDFNGQKSYFTIRNNTAFLIQLFNDYYNNQENFEFEVSLSLNINEINLTSQVKSIVVHRNNFIKKIVEFYYYHFTNIIKNRNNVSVEYTNYNNFRVKHKIDISNFKENLNSIKLSNIINSNNIYNDYNIFFDNSKDVPRLYLISDFYSLEDLYRNSLESEEDNEIVFYTYNQSTSENFTSQYYVFSYFINEKEFGWYVEGTDSLLDNSRILSQDIDNIGSDIIEVNNVISENIELEFLENDAMNLNLSQEEPSLLNLDLVKINNLNSLLTYSNKFGYDNTTEFLQNMIVRVTSSSYFNTLSSKKSEIVSTFILSELFNINASITENIFNSTFDFKSILGVDLDLVSNVSKNQGNQNLSFVTDKFSYVEKLEMIRRLASENFNFYYTKDIKLQFFPVHYLLHKYKDAGLDESNNINNVFNNIEELEKLENLLYEIYFKNDPELALNSYEEIKRSYFNNIDRRKTFYNSINKIFESLSSSLKNLKTKAERRLSYEDFELKILNESNVVKNNVDERYNFKFSERMFRLMNQKQSRFPYLINGITSNFKQYLDKTKPLRIILNFSDTLSLDASFLNKIYADYENNEYETIDKLRLDVKLNLVPYFKCEKYANVSSANDKVFSKVLVNGVDCLTLKSSQFRKSIVGYEKSLYEGVKNVDIVGLNTENTLASINMNKYDLDLFKTDVYRAYLNSGLINKLNSENSTELFELGLRVCLIATVTEKSGNNIYYSDYQTILIFNNTNKNNSININNIQSITFNKK
jgi:hypothetical protein